jgi:tRNA threonylcarbamoyladenosine biosynthesis protein TsaB
LPIGLPIGDCGFAEDCRVLIAALDTSSAAGSAAVVRDGTMVVERAGDGSRTHGERLPRELMSLLAAAGVELREIDRFAVSVGPGSFTGLRVGIATIQGLAFAQEKLVVPVSSFEALAFSTGAPRRPASAAVGTWIDAHRGEVFAALYDADGGELAGPTSLTPEATLDSWSQPLARFDRVRFAGNGAILYRERIAARLGARATIDADVPALAGPIGLIAAGADNRAVLPHAIVPLYVRRPDAVLAKEKRDAAREP